MAEIALPVGLVFSVNSNGYISITISGLNNDNPDIKKGALYIAKKMRSIRNSPNPSLVDNVIAITDLKNVKLAMENPSDYAEADLIAGVDIVFTDGTRNFLKYTYLDRTAPGQEGITDNLKLFEYLDGLR